MPELHDQLQRRAQRLNRFQQHQQQRLEWAFNARLATAGFFLFLMILATLAPKLHLELPTLLIGPPLFIAFAVRSQKIQKAIKKLAALQLFYQRQAQRRRGIPVDTGIKLAVPPWALTHPLNRDLDILGEHSLFNLIDETLTQEGGERLIKALLNPGLSPAQLENRQNNIKSLTQFVGPMRRIVVEGHTQNLHRSLAGLRQTLLNPIVGPTFRRDYRILLALYGLLWINLVLGGLALPNLPASWLWLGFALFSLARLQQTGKSFTRGQDLSLSIAPWSTIFARLENLQKSAAWPHPLLNQLAHHRPARHFAILDRWLTFLSVQSHPLVLILLNVLAPWNFVFSHLLERQRQKLATGIDDCLGDLHEFEVLQSFAFVATYQPTQFPEFVEPQAMRLEQIYHPLLPREKIIANTFSWQEGQQIALITGSNMSGKSTFLRAVGLHQVMALAGAPAFALTPTKAAPLNVVSSMRVADSVEKGYSSFYAEVRSVKDILDRAQHEQLLFLIDEIFSGTNSRERFIGSYSVLTALLRTQSYGFISTHDLELTQMGPDGKIANWHFREDIENEKMVFRYQLLPGPCPTTNALRVMQMAGLEITHPETT